MIATIVIGVACVGMFVAALMAGAGICRLITRFKKREGNDVSEQEHQLRNVFQGRVIEFYVPDNLRSNFKVIFGPITGAVAVPLRGKLSFPLGSQTKT